MRVGPPRQLLSEEFGTIPATAEQMCQDRIPSDRTAGITVTMAADSADGDPAETATTDADPTDAMTTSALSRTREVTRLPNVIQLVYGRIYAPDRMRSDLPRADRDGSPVEGQSDPLPRHRAHSHLVLHEEQRAVVEPHLGAAE